MNDGHRNHQRRSREVEDALDEGMGMGMGANSNRKNRRSIVARKGLMASVVRAASAVNNILLENCGLCTVYCDKQVQYEEYAQQQYEVGVGAMEHLYSQLNPSAAAATTTNCTTTAGAVDIGCDHNERNESDDESCQFIEMKTPPSNHHDGAEMNTSERINAERYYREFLFDEESVVRTVGSRGALDDEE
eukprot:jgi/Psemu1/299829/fgenesh1_kg.2_\